MIHIDLKINISNNYVGIFVFIQNLSYDDLLQSYIYHSILAFQTQLMIYIYSREKLIFSTTMLVFFPYSTVDLCFSKMML